MKSRCGKVMASAERRVYVARRPLGRSAVTGRMIARRVKTCILMNKRAFMYSRQRSMGTKRDLVHEMRFQGCFWCEFRCALAHTCSVVPESSLTPLGGVTRVLLCVRASIRSEPRLHHSAIKVPKSHVKLGYKSPGHSGAIDKVIFSKFCIPAILIGSPHHVPKHMDRRGIKYHMPRSTERVRPVRAAMRVMRPT